MTCARRQYSLKQTERYLSPQEVEGCVFIECVEPEHEETLGPVGPGLASRLEDVEGR